MTSSTRGGDDAGMGPVMRALVAYGLVTLSPALAWLVWISWSDDKASDAMHVAWFATVAIACLAAGVMAPRGAAGYLPLFVLAPAATMLVLYLWWSTEDVTGLYMVGILFATPLVVATAAVLLIVGRVCLSPHLTATPLRRGTGCTSVE